MCSHFTSDEFENLGLDEHERLSHIGWDLGAAELAKQLTIIETQVPSALENPAVTRSELDEARLNRLFDEMEFGGMLRRRCLLT